MLKGMARHLSRHWIGRGSADTSGVVALEFALVTPVMLVMLAATYDLVQVLITQQRMGAATLAITQMVTNLSAQADGTNSISGHDVQISGEAAFIYLPGWLATSQDRYSVTISSVKTTLLNPGCTSSCTYLATLAWSQALNQGTPARRHCGLQLPSPPAPPSADTLDPGVIGSSPLAVVDLTYNYKPLFFGFVASSFPISRTIALPTRIGGPRQYITYVKSDDIPQSSGPSDGGYVACPQGT